MAKLSSFTINSIFIALMLLGLNILPYVSLQLSPSSRSNHFGLNFYWYGASPELLESEVTCKLEALLSSVSGLEKISSNTSHGSGSIKLEVDKNENIDALKLYLSSIVRAASNSFPEGVSVSGVYGGEYKSGKVNESEQKILLEYIVTGKESSDDVSTYCESLLFPTIGMEDGVDKVTISGATSDEWVMHYREEELKEFGLSISDLHNAVRNYHGHWEIGRVMEQDGESYNYAVVHGNNDYKDYDLLSIPIKQVEGRMIRIGDVVDLSKRVKPVSSYYRINGLDRLTMVVYATPDANMLELSSRVQNVIEEQVESAKDGFTVELARDRSLDVKDELAYTLGRTSLTVLILLLFVYLVTRSLRHLLIIAISLIANILIALIFYYLFAIEIHLYTLAGINISFGIIIDNIIVMSDHYRLHRDRKVFLAILAATLTTMGALVVIFNMDNPVMDSMMDFTAVIIINLVVSLFVSLFFVPALLDKIGGKFHKNKQSTRSHRRVVRFTRLYKRLIIGMGVRRKWFIILAVLLFGLPIMIIPRKIEPENRYEQPSFLVSTYNECMSSGVMTTSLPYLEKYLGGTLRLFTSGVGGDWFKDEEQKKQITRLNVNLKMPHGATLEQMNEAAKKVDAFLASQDELSIFRTNVYSANNASITVEFKKESERDGTPERIKSELILFVNGIGNADADIFGVGKGFSNELGDEQRSEQLRVVGYNYRKVKEYAEVLQNRLERYQRVKNTFIGNEEKSAKIRELQLDVDKDALAYYNSSPSNMMWGLRGLMGQNDSHVDTYIDGDLTSIAFSSVSERDPSLWQLTNAPLKSSSGSSFRVIDIGEISNEYVFDDIQKVNQEYEVWVHYDFIGSWNLSRKVKRDVIEEMKWEMPIGFRVEEPVRRWEQYWEKVGGIDERVWYIFIVICIIIIICSILLESIKQAFIVVAIAPLSFIGCFLGFYIFGLRFNEGGLAAFILMCGLSVNAVLYIINDYNLRNKHSGPRNPLDQFLHAYNAKIVPIILTVISTVLGFIPFLIGDVSDFWYSLTVGIMSGLIFSLLAMFFYLPLFWRWKEVREWQVERISWRRRCWCFVKDPSSFKRVLSGVYRQIKKIRKKIKERKKL